MYKKNIGIYTSILIIATLFLGIGYANVSNINLSINGDATLIQNENIEIKSVTLKEELNANTSESKVLNVAKTLLQTKVVLGSDKSSYVTYRVAIENNTSDDLYFIDVLKNENFYTNSQGNVNTQIIYEVSGIKEYDVIEKDGGKLSFDLTFKYDVENSEVINTSNQELNSYLNFKFRKVYNITYIGFDYNNYPSKLISGEDCTITFQDELPVNVLVSGDVSSYYIDGVLTLTDISSDIVITKEGVDVQGL